MSLQIEKHELVTTDWWPMKVSTFDPTTSASRKDIAGCQLQGVAPPRVGILCKGQLQWRLIYPNVEV